MSTTKTLIDPFQQIKALNEISDRLFFPMSSIIDGDMTNLLDSTMALPPGTAVGARGHQLNKSIPEDKRGDSPWLMRRLGQVQEAVAKKKLAEQSRADARAVTSKEMNDKELVK